jgi:hypothetical protein
MNHRQREADGYRRIHRIAALLQDFNAGLRCRLIHAGYHGMARMDRMSRFRGSRQPSQASQSSSQ